MRALRLAFGTLMVVVLIQLIPVYYQSSEFARFVQRETQRVRMKDDFKRLLMNRATEAKLPVGEDNINITVDGSILRVDIAYRVPVNFYLFRHELSFRTVAAGLVSTN